MKDTKGIELGLTTVYTDLHGWAAATRLVFKGTLSFLCNLLVSSVRTGNTLSCNLSNRIVWKIYSQMPSRVCEPKG